MSTSRQSLEVHRIIHHDEVRHHLLLFTLQCLLISDALESNTPHSPFEKTSPPSRAAQFELVHKEEARGTHYSVKYTTVLSLITSSVAPYTKGVSCARYDPTWSLSLRKQHRRFSIPLHSLFHLRRHVAQFQNHGKERSCSDPSFQSYCLPLCCSWFYGRCEGHEGFGNRLSYRCAAFASPSRVVDHEYDCVVVGAGGAGLRAAMGLSEHVGVFSP